MSRIGKKPVPVPDGVKVQVKDGVVAVEGPKGSLSQPLRNQVKVEIEEKQVLVKRFSDGKFDKSVHGLYRALIANMIKGVTQGYTKELEIVGIGFKAQVEANRLKMQLGYSHPVIFSIPEGIKIETPKQTQIVVKGIDKEKVGEVASEIRYLCPPEPYKGKGIRFAGEYVKRKAGKAAQATK
jgi:large subunit ribosomal protein L6